MLRFSCTAVCLFLLFPTLSQTQTPTKRSSTPSQLQDSALAKPRVWGSIEVRFFSDTTVKFSFSLATSWIPGEGHKGMLRYRLLGSPVYPPMAQQGQEYAIANIEKLVKRVHACTLFLDLLDVDAFKLRSIALPVNYIVDANARLTDLEVNDSSQMDAREYRTLLGEGERSGSWSIAWRCGDF